jgi:hypothetical protein
VWRCVFREEKKQRNSWTMKFMLGVALFFPLRTKQRHTQQIRKSGIHMTTRVFFDKSLAGR